jgi:NADP-dependent 3-hydroxy acid dehydrogenase YdfG
MTTASKLKNKVAIITGASQGIGRASALTLAGEGVNLVLIGRNEEKLSSLKDECQKLGVEVKTLAFDLTQIERLNDLVSDILGTFPKVDFLINNAGTYVRGNLNDSALSEWDYLLNLNFRSVYHLTNRLLPSIQQGGAIINVSSISAHHFNKGGEIYSATKAALKAYSNCLFESIREKGIKVSCFYPGYVNTELGRENALEPEKMIQPNDIAEAIRGVINAPINVCSTEIIIRPQFSPYRK